MKLTDYQQSDNDSRCNANQFTMTVVLCHTVQDVCMSLIYHLISEPPLVTDINIMYALNV